MYGKPRVFYRNQRYGNDEYRGYSQPGFSVVIGTHEGHVTRVESTRQYDLDFGTRLTREKAIQEGDLVCSLMWNTDDDLDLRCITPFGEEISYRQRKNAGGELDVDMNATTTTNYDSRYREAGL